MLVFGVITPYAVVTIPAFGGTKSENIPKTISALEVVRGQFKGKNPRRLVIVSAQPNEGFNVPLFWFGKQLGDKIEIERVLADKDNPDYYYGLGRKYSTEIEKDPLPTAVIASAHIARTLNETESRTGGDFDEIIRRTVLEKDPSLLLNLDTKFVHEADSNALNPILFLFGVFQDRDYETKIWGYEELEGTGLLVSTFDPKTKGY